MKKKTNPQNIMKPLSILSMSAAILLASCSSSSKEQATDQRPLIGPSTIQLANRQFTPEALWAMGRIGDVSVAPNGEQIAYSVAYYSVEQNRSNRELYVMQADGSNLQQLTRDNFQQSQPIWIKQGSRIAYLSNEGGDGSQVWEMNPDGTDRHQLTHYEGDIEGFAFSPNGQKLLFIAQVKTVKSTAEEYPDLPLASGVIVEDLMYKHWDEWTTTAPHPFVADFDGNGISNVRDLLEGEPFESPMKPFGGIEQLAWSPTSDKVAYTCRKKTGLAYAISTDSDIYEYDLNTGRTTNLCKSAEQAKEYMGYDTNPQYSPDGRYIAWQSMERDGYEADLNRLIVMDRTTGEKRFVSKAFRSNVDQFLWNTDSQTIYFLGIWHGLEQIYCLHLDQSEEQDPTACRIELITSTVADYGSLALLGNELVAKRHSMSMGDEIFRIGAEEVQLSHVNQHIYDQVDMGRVEARWQKTTDGQQMLSWIIYPPHFDPSKKYPTLLFCEGGPQSPVSQFWSYRWNFQVMAAQGYIIVAPNRRGLPGFGPEWNEQISGDYGGQCMKDYFTAIDEFCTEPYVDRDHLGCVGASFGGFSVYWLAGHHNKRFKAFIAHDGIFNLEMQYLETEEKWFANWDMGGAYWEKQNAVAQRTFANSPHRFVDRWDTPILCIHGEKDYRILPNHAMAAFDAAVMRGVPAQLLIYPDENHWVLKPQNGILWQRTFFRWLDRWLKPAK